VLGGRAQHLGAQQAAAASLGVDLQRTLVAAHDPAAALVGKRHFADLEVGARCQQFGVRGAHQCHLRLAEDHGQRRAARPLAHVGPAAGVVAGDAPFVGGLMQQRTVVRRIARHEHGAFADLAGATVEHRHALAIERQRCVFEAHAVDVGAAAGGGQQELEALLLHPAVRKHAAQCHRVTVATGLQVLHTQRQRQLAAEHLAGQRLQRRMGQRADAAAAAEKPHTHTQAVQRLRQLKPDHAGAHHRHRVWKIGPVENIVIDDQTIAQVCPPGRRHGRARSCGNDDALRLQAPGAGGAIDGERLRVNEAGMSLPPVCGGPLLHGIDDEPDKAVTLAAHARHHGPAVDVDARHVHAKAAGVPRRVRHVRRRDQQLAGHAAHACAGGAVDVALDEDHALRVTQRGAVRSHARRARADDGHVGLYRSCRVCHRRPHRPRALKPGWSSGRLPCGQCISRSSAGMGLSLMLAKRICIKPCSSKTQFSLP
jgi:hypothetical protein